MILLVGDGSRADVVHGIAQVEPLVRELASESVLVDLDRSIDLAQNPPRLVFNFGGDGSILHIAGRLGALQVPILGVNFGKFGFLAEYELPEVLVRLEEALAERLPVRHSLMLRVTIRAGQNTLESWAVNDVVLQRPPDGRMSDIHARQDEALIASYYGDGLIVSTPLGSTAHNLSAGGPLLHPELEALVLTPICAHTLSIRPLTVPAGLPLSLSVNEGDSVCVTMDGRGAQRLQGGDEIRIEKAPLPLTLVAHPTRSYFDTLRRKFGWSERSASHGP